MSCIFFTLTTVLLPYISCSTLSSTVSSGVVWRTSGQMVTIQCKSPKDQDNLTLKGGLYEDFDVAFRDSTSTKTTAAEGFRDRLQINGVFPNLDILIKNLTSKDTGPYWCEYKKFDKDTGKTQIQKGPGSVLLVVTEPHVNDNKGCDPSDKNLVLVPVVISAVLLFGIIMVVLVWILKNKKTLHPRSKPKRPATNDVYEDMRGTLRR